ncbi:MAG: toprim domain-containing protein [Cytophagales bacterium]|nr:toprim domain-containing protein [Cytophagales bacterium]
MSLYSELIALAFKGLDASEYLHQFVSENPMEEEGRKVYRLSKSLSIAVDDQKTKSELEVAKNAGFFAKDNKICFTDGRQVSYQTLLEIVKYRTGRRTNEHAIYKMLNFDYDGFMSNMRKQLKERLTPQDVLQTVGGTQKKGERDMYYLESKPQDGLFHIIPPRNGKNGMWTFKNSTSYPPGYLGNLFDLYCYATGKPSNLSSVKQAYKDIFGEDVNMHILNFLKVQRGISVNSPVVTKVLQRNLSEFKKEDVVHPELPHIAMKDINHRYLRYRGITLDTINAPQFAGLLGTELSLENGKPEKMGYRQDAAVFPPLSFVYKDINGRIINKEFKNYYSRRYWTELKNVDPTVKRSFARHKGSRSASVFVTNPPANPTHIVLLESPLDALSYYQHNRGKVGFEWIDNAIFVANGGTLSIEQVPIIEKLIRHYNVQTIVPAMDKDMQGRSYNLAMIGLLNETSGGAMVRHTDANGTEIECLGENALERFDAIHRQLKKACLQGGVTAEPGRRKMWFFYSEANYEKVAEVLASNRKNHLNIMLSTPANAKDWNDEMRGLVQEPQKGNRPLLYWLSRRQEASIMKKIDFAEISLQWDSGAYRVKNGDGQVVGIFNLEEMEFKPYQSMVAYLSSPIGKPINDDISKLKDFLLSGVDGNKIIDAQTQGIYFKKSKAFVGATPIASWDGKNLEVSENLDENIIDRLEVMKEFLKHGLNPNMVFMLEGNTLVLNTDKSQYKMFALSVNMQPVELDGYRKFIEVYPILRKTVNTLLEKAISALPDKGVVVMGRGTEFAVYEDSLVWNGKLGHIGDNGRFMLEKNRLDEALPEFVYEEIEKFERVGAEAYRKSINYNKRIRIDLDYNLLIDKHKVGHVVADKTSGEIFIELRNPNKEILEALHAAGVPEKYLKTNGQEVDYSTSITAKNSRVDEDMVENICHVKLQDDKEYLMVGDMQVGIWDSGSGKFKFTSSLGAPHPDILKEVEVLEAKRRSISLIAFNNETAPDNLIDDRGLLTQIKTEYTIEIGEKSSLANIIEDKELPIELHGEKFERKDAFATEWEHSIWALKNDPKWSELIVQRNGEVELLGFSAGKKTEVLNVGTDHPIKNGFVRTNLSSLEHDKVILAQSPKAALTYYLIHRRDLIFNGKVSLFAATDEGQEKMAALSAAMLKPTNLVFVGDEAFLERAGSFSKYFKGQIDFIDAKPLMELYLPTGDKKHLSVKEYDVIQDWILDTRKDRIYFPVSAWDGDKFVVTGAGELFSKDKKLILSMDSPGVYLSKGHGRTPEILYVASEVNKEFIEHVKMGYATALSPDVNSLQLGYAVKHLGFQKLEVLSPVNEKITIEQENVIENQFQNEIHITL